MYPPTSSERGIGELRIILTTLVPVKIEQDQDNADTGYPEPPQNYSRQCKSDGYPPKKDNDE